MDLAIYGKIEEKQLKLKLTDDYDEIRLEVVNEHGGALVPYTSGVLLWIDKKTKELTLSNTVGEDLGFDLDEEGRIKLSNL